MDNIVHEPPQRLRTNVHHWALKMHKTIIDICFQYGTYFIIEDSDVAADKPENVTPYARQH